MTRDRTNHTVEGEPLDLLVEALGEFQTRPTNYGGVAISFSLEPRLGEPFARALMRAESRLLLEDADKVGQPCNEPRTDEQRAADALVELAKSVGEALQDTSDRRPSASRRQMPRRSHP